MQSPSDTPAAVIPDVPTTPDAPTATALPVAVAQSQRQLIEVFYLIPKCERDAESLRVQISTAFGQQEWLAPETCNVVTNDAKTKRIVIKAVFAVKRFEPSLQMPSLRA